MIRLFCLLIFNLSLSFCFSQNEIIREQDISDLNNVISALEKKYKDSTTPVLSSVPQTTATYFEIETNDPELFLKSLNSCSSIENLKKEFRNLQLDRDLLITKSVSTNYENIKQLEIHSYEIGNSRRHEVSLKFTDSLNQPQIKYFHSTFFDRYENKTSISGFFLEEKFKCVPILPESADYINYADILIKPETSIFLDYDRQNDNYFSREKTIIDSLSEYFSDIVNKNIHFSGFSFELPDSIIQKKQELADSLYKNDLQFFKLLNDALDFAENAKKSNINLEDLTSQLISKERALTLMRYRPVVGSCSFDNSPVRQLKRIAGLAAQTHNWEVFIQSFLNIMNDFADRVASNSFATQMQETYVEELLKLNIDINQLLLGPNWKISDTLNKHYFSEGFRVAKAYANLNNEYQNFFENYMLKIIADDKVDVFNRLNAYNTLKNYQYFLKDSLKNKELDQKIEKIIINFPYEIKSRILNQNKQLYDLLYDEDDLLDKFIIESSIIGNIYSSSFNGNCWTATLTEKNKNGKISYDLTMPVGKKITSLKNFLKQKKYLDRKVKNHNYLQKILSSSEKNSLTISFTNDRSYIERKKICCHNIPENITSNFNFIKAISLYFTFNENNYVNFILLNNNYLLLLEIPENFTLPGYSFNELVTSEEESLFSTKYYSFKLFNEKGEMVN